MKISPMASPQNTVAPNPQSPATQASRTLRMNTNATPGRIEAQVEELPPAVPPQADPALANSADNKTAEGSEETKPLSPQYAALAKQKRALQVKERELQAREEALKSQTPAQGVGIDVAKLKAQPLKVMLEHGVTYEQLTQAILEDQNGGFDAEALREQILKDVTTNVEKRFADKASQDEQQVLSQIKADASTLVSSGDDFELVREQGLIDEVPKLALAIYRDEGKVLSPREYLEIIEGHALEDAMKVAALKKVQGRLQPAPPALATPQQQRPAMRTLTNRDTAQVPMDRKTRALLAFRGQLTKGA